MHIMDPAIIIRGRDPPVFNVNQMLDPVRIDQQTRPLVDVDPGIRARPGIRRADLNRAVPGAVGGPAAHKNFPGHSDPRNPGDGHRIIQRRDRDRRMVGISLAVIHLHRCCHLGQRIRARIIRSHEVRNGIAGRPIHQVQFSGAVKLAGNSAGAGIQSSRRAGRVLCAGGDRDRRSGRSRFARSKG